MSTAIEWTDATWNPVTGCSHVSPGCTHCYAESLSLRFGWSRKPWTAPNVAENVVLHPDRLRKPLQWRDPLRVFVNSMSDLFHEQIPDEFIAQVFAVMAICSKHTFQVLTKRPDRMLRLLADSDWPGAIADEAATLADDWYRGPGPSTAWDLIALNALSDAGHTMPWPLTNVWLGVSVEDQRRADERIPLLLDTPAAVRFLSCEPLLGPLDLRKWLSGCGGAPVRPTWPLNRLGWVIAGGESGPHFRPLDLNWARSIRDQCLDAGVPFLFKQVGGRTPKSGGRLLDGQIWDEYPEVVA